MNDIHKWLLGSYKKHARHVASDKASLRDAVNGTYIQSNISIFSMLLQLIDLPEQFITPIYKQLLTHLLLYTFSYTYIYRSYQIFIYYKPKRRKLLHTRFEG